MVRSSRWSMPIAKGAPGACKWTRIIEPSNLEHEVSSKNDRSSISGTIACLVLLNAVHADSASFLLRYVMSAAKTAAFAVLCIC